uniref:Uncharacterized protein n=1 Tax=Magallana gigas TaxID=29159 RepID=K1Q526_MAGGI
MKQNNAPSKEYLLLNRTFPPYLALRFPCIMGNPSAELKWMLSMSEGFYILFSELRLPCLSSFGYPRLYPSAVSVKKKDLAPETNDV